MRGDTRTAVAEGFAAPDAGDAGDADPVGRFAALFTPRFAGATGATEAFIGFAAGRFADDFAGALAVLAGRATFFAAAAGFRIGFAAGFAGFFATGFAGVARTGFAALRTFTGRFAFLPDALTFFTATHRLLVATGKPGFWSYFNVGR
ncbi:MAG: hypothetical protein ABI639_05335 [Thermoanaerobaculia bacterium]